MKEKKDETLSDEKCELAKPDYETLWRRVKSLDTEIFNLNKENEALRYSLTEIYKRIECSKEEKKMWEEEYYKEHKRAEKLYDELNKKAEKLYEELKRIRQNIQRR